VKIGKLQIERTFKIVDEFAPEIDAFASAIQNHGTVEPDGIQGHRDIIIIDAIYKSAREKRTVAIEY
jgi:predicted dehydrogenase